MTLKGHLHPYAASSAICCRAPEAAINEEPSECVSLPYSDELTPNARGEPRPRAGARHEHRLLGVGLQCLVRCAGRQQSSACGALVLRLFQSVCLVFPSGVNPQLSCEGCRGRIRRIPTRFYSVL